MLKLHFPADIAEGQVTTLLRPLWQKLPLKIKFFCFFPPLGFPDSHISGQEEEADGEVLMVIKNQPVQLVCSMVLPGHRFVTCTFIIF